MKKYFYLALALCMGFAATSCDEEDGPDEPIIDPVMHTVTFEGDYWSALIDTPQYGGDLLYGSGKDDYAWTDEVTGLNGGLTRSWGGDYGYAEGGSALSNYIESDIEGHISYTYQLAVPESNGSENFVVAYCPAFVKFPEGVSRRIHSMDIMPTTYLLGVMTYGDGYAAPLKEDGYLTLIIEADNGKSVEVDLARDGDIMSTWHTIDLTALGEVNSLTFSMDGSDQSSFGVKHPAYFAFDNVVVEM